MANKRYVYLIDQLKQLGVTAPAVVVDCGCGDGTGAKYLHLAGFEVHGYDISDKCLKDCADEGIDARYGDIKSLSIEDNYADVFICSETLEHLSRKESLFAAREIRRVCKTGGYVAITVPQDKKICLANKNHKQYLSKDDLLEHFDSCLLVFNGFFFKNPKKCNQVVIFQN